ncbi:MAG: DUF1036 domain-containing protein [Rhizobiaceae bacterium]|nr:DUF1036 domain-containing protein [Rhizobiaceae bacterium]
MAGCSRAAPPCHPGRRAAGRACEAASVPLRRHLAAAVFALLAWVAAAGPARAEFTVCNQSLDVVNLAVGQEVSDPAEPFWQTEGWWTVGANRCVKVIRDELVNRFIYVYATDVFGQPLLRGTTDMCVGNRRFVIRGSDECWVRGYRQVPFYEVDTLKTERWTLFLGSGGLQ